MKNHINIFFSEIPMSHTVSSEVPLKQGELPANDLNLAILEFTAHPGETYATFLVPDLEDVPFSIMVKFDVRPQLIDFKYHRDRIIQVNFQNDDVISIGTSVNHDLTYSVHHDQNATKLFIKNTNATQVYTMYIAVVPTVIIEGDSYAGSQESMNFTFQARAVKCVTWDRTLESWQTAGTLVSLIFNITILSIRVATCLGNVFSIS